MRTGGTTRSRKRDSATKTARRSFPGQRAARLDSTPERGPEDVPQEDSREGSQHDGKDAPEAQLRPAVVDDKTDIMVIVV
jgi:hypothetical protein